MRNGEDTVSEVTGMPTVGSQVTSVALEGM